MVGLFFDDAFAHVLGVKVVVSAVWNGHELVMGALFLNDAFVKEDDLVRILDRGEAVCDDERRASDENAVHGLLDGLFGGP